MIGKESLEPPAWLSVYGWLSGQNLVGGTAHAKRRHLLRLLKTRGHRVFVEADTYTGGTTAFFAKRAEVISVELHDGHFSGPGTAEGKFTEPAEATLDGLAAVAPPGTTVVIDDLRLFGSGLYGFPDLDAITASDRKAFPHAVIRTGMDSIVVEA